ncbi:MAG: oligosaccharide flippase family protein [Bacteroidota bacterium]
MIKKLKTLLREKNMSSLMGNVTVAAMGLLSFMLLSRQLTKVDFGHFILFMTLSSFVDLLRFGLTQNALIRLLTVADQQGAKRIMGSGFAINIIVLIILSVVLWGLYGVLSFFEVSIGLGYLLFLKWYPILGVVNLGWNNAMALFQAEQRFMRMMYVRLSTVGTFNLFLGLNLLFFSFPLETILLFFIGFNGLASIISALKRWDGLQDLPNAERATAKDIVQFGKYAMGTLVGSSLLKSADTFIIGMSPFMGASAIAIYAIPLKITDLLGIPLRSFSMTAYPKMSKMYMDKAFGKLRNTFYEYVGTITVLFIPVIVGCVLLSSELIIVLGGAGYTDELPVLTNIFMIFSVYLLLLPLDRFTGVLLDSINKPNLNLKKVIFMASANILVDAIAVFWFQSLLVVALGTVLFTLLGIVLGLYLLKREIGVEGHKILPQSYRFLKNFSAQWQR